MLGVIIFFFTMLFLSAILGLAKEGCKAIKKDEEQPRFNDLLEIIEKVYEEAPTTSSKSGKKNYKKNYNSNNYYRRNNYKKKVSN